MEETLPDPDVLCMTRVQRERFFNEEDYLRLKDRFILDTGKMGFLPEKAIVMHPLPRVNETSSKVDGNPCVCYFRQVENGNLCAWR